MLSVSSDLTPDILSTFVLVSVSRMMRPLYPSLAAFSAFLANLHSPLRTTAILFVEAF